MCGVLAVIGAGVRAEPLLEAVRVMSHRGPDGDGVWCAPDGSVGVAHVRLAIIDPIGGAQPLLTDDAQQVLVANGEIYDFERIRAELQASGHRFRTASDSEVILHLYLEHGLDMFEHLRGEFAFVLVDLARDRVIAARDRFGIKPLFEATTADGHVFASEAKAMFATGRVQARIDPVAVRDALSLVLPGCLFEGIAPVPPGTAVVVEHGVRRVVRYWAPDLDGRGEAPEGDLPESVLSPLRDQVDEAVRLRLRADVPVGVYLSGGVDSAAVVATAARFAPERLHAFTLSFTDHARYDELDAAREMAAHADVTLHELPVDRHDLTAHVEDFAWHVESLFGNLHGVGKYLLSRFASQTVKVVLTGEGSDEVFLGYDFYRLDQDRVIDRFAEGGGAGPSRVTATRSMIEAVLGFLPFQDHQRTLAPASQWMLSWLLAARHGARLAASTPLDRLRAQIDPEQVADRPLLTRVQYYTWQSMLGRYVLPMLGDRPEMAHGIEGRTPLLDHHLVDHARGLPNAIKLRGDREKHVFREAMADRVSPTIRAARKWPFVAPPVEVRRGTGAPMDHLVDRYLSRDMVRRAGLFRWWAVLALRVAGRLTSRFAAAHEAVHALLMCIVSAHVLHVRFVEPVGEDSEGVGRRVGDGTGGQLDGEDRAGEARR